MTQQWSIFSPNVNIDDSRMNVFPQQYLQAFLGTRDPRQPMSVQLHCASSLLFRHIVTV